MILVFQMMTLAFAQQNLEVKKSDQPIVIDGFLEPEWILSDSIGFSWVN